MSERPTLITEFLAGAGLADARRDPLPGDASTRRYERLTTATGTTLMLMDQAPALESPPCDPRWTPEERRGHGWNATARLSAGRIEAFAAVADHLRGAGLSAPEVVALSAANGLAVLEDLGDDLYARSIERGADERALYLEAVETLARLHRTAALPDRLAGPGGEWPLLTYDATALQAGADLFIEWMPKLVRELAFGPDARDEWQAAWAPVVAMGEAGATVMAHRDYHAENLLWLPGRAGVQRVGLIDFQDAVRAHPVWDLHSLLQDARRDVSPAIEQAAMDHYIDVMQVDGEALRADYAALAALNEARILGVFARLIARDGKPRYREFMPRMWAHLEQNLKRPGLTQVRVWFDRHVPKEMRG